MVWYHEQIGKTLEPSEIPELVDEAEAMKGAMAQLMPRGTPTSQRFIARVVHQVDVVHTRRLRGVRGHGTTHKFGRQL